MATRVLVVDDDPDVREVLCRWLSDEGYRSGAAADGEEALDALAGGDHELVLLDINLPDISGLEVLARAKAQSNDLAVIMISGVDDRAMGLRCIHLGAHSYVLKPFEREEVIINVDGALQARRRGLESKTYQERLEREVRERTEEVRRREEEIALRLVAAAEYRDEETSGHVRRIGMFAEILARALGWDPQKIEDIRVAATMHDIGKIGVPDGILLKPGKLTPEEYEVVKLHTEIGARMLAGSRAPLLQMAEGIAQSHHEKWDGSGYPEGLAGEKIPQAARIVAIADVFDSLTHDRIHRPAFAEEKALDVMHEGKAEHFDPQILDIFFESLPAFRRVQQQVADEVG